MGLFSKRPDEGLGSDASPLILKNHLWALTFCGYFAVGAFLFGYDQSYFTGIEAMTLFINKYGNVTSSAGVVSFSPTLLAVLTSIIQVGDLIGALSAGVVGHYFGRKGGLFTASILACIAVILQATAPNNAAFIAGRIILGLGVGMLSNVVPLYLSEVGPKQIRAIVVGSFQLTLATAGVVGAAINQGTKGIQSSASYLIPICFQLICPLVFFTFYYWIPESPKFLVSKNKLEEASQALCKINRSDKDYDPTIQMNEFKLDVEAEKLTDRGGWLQLITDPVERRKVFCCAGIFAAQQLTGTTFITTYCTVFATDLQIANPFDITIIHNVLSVCGVLVSWTFIERVNRKAILLCTTAVMICFMLIIGGLASGPQKAPLVPEPPLAKTIISFILIYIFFFNLGWGPLAWTVASEMAVGRNRPRIMAVGTAVFWVASWLITFTLPYLFTTARLGAKIGYVYAGSATLSFLFVFFVIGETRGRTLEEIDEMLLDRVPARQWSTHRTRIRGEAEARGVAYLQTKMDVSGDQDA